MPIPDPGFHVLTGTTGIAMRRDPADDSKVLGVELCPDCAWDCYTTEPDSCGGAFCSGPAERPVSITVEVNLGQISGCTFNCTSWDGIGDPPCGGSAGCVSTVNCDPCNCANGAYVLDRQPPPTPTSLCNYEIIFEPNEWGGNCCDTGDNHRKAILVSFLNAANGNGDVIIAEVWPKAYYPTGTRVHFGSPTVVDCSKRFDVTLQETSGNCSGTVRIRA